MTAVIALALGALLLAAALWVWLRRWLTVSTVESLRRQRFEQRPARLDVHRGQDCDRFWDDWFKHHRGVL